METIENAVATSSSRAQMRFHSTPESVQKGEITKLAIIECILSVALYVGIGFYLGSFRYLAWAVVVAPLMLFRTERSAKWGLEQIYEPFIKKAGARLDSPVDRSGVLNIGIIILEVISIVSSVAVVGCLTRIVSPVIWLFRKPLEALEEAPFNWQRQCLCTDFYLPPEIVPLETTSSIELPTFTKSVDDALRNTKGPIETLVTILISFPLAMGFLPPLLYRVTFKATAVAYLPFIWIVHWTLSKTVSVKSRLERITTGELEKVRRGVSWSILLILIAKVALIYGWIDLAFLVSKFPNQKIVDYFVAPTHWPWWQLTLISDAVLTFLLFFFADAALARLDGEGAWSGPKILTAISYASFGRAVVSLATISHFFYIAFISVVPQTFKHFLS